MSCGAARTDHGRRGRDCGVCDAVLERLCFTLPGKKMRGKDRKMQLGIRLHDLEKLPFEERIAKAAEGGFACGHLALSKLITEFPTADEALTPGLAMYIRKVFERNHVDIAVLGCYLNLATPDEKALEKTMHRYLAHIRFASLLGCGVVGTETGAPNAEYAFTPECRTEKTLELFIERLRPVVAYAEKMGVVFAIEPVAKHIVCTPARARRVLDEIASPNLQIIFDPVNLLDGTNYTDREKIFDEAIGLLGEDIAMVHLKDFRTGNGDLTACACGTGEMDYTKILHFMKTRKPFIHTTLENTTPKNNQTAKELILRKYAEA